MVGSRVASLLTYTVSSLLIVLVNKELLSAGGCAFPCRLILLTSHLLFCSASIGIAGLLGLLPIRFRWAFVKEVAPLAVVFTLNILTGMIALQLVQVPLFSMARRLSLFFVMFGQWAVLGMTPRWTYVACLLLIVAGSYMATASDLAFDVWGYVAGLFNNVLTAAYLVGIKWLANRRAAQHTPAPAPATAEQGQQSEHDPADAVVVSGVRYRAVSPPPEADPSQPAVEIPEAHMNKLETLMYNAVASIPVIVGASVLMGEWTELGQWVAGGDEAAKAQDNVQSALISPCFLLLCASVALSLCVNVGQFWCTELNSPLTCSVSGQVKNLVASVLSMVFFGLRVEAGGFAVGFVLNVLGSVGYMYFKYRESNESEKDGKVKK